MAPGLISDSLPTSSLPPLGLTPDQISRYHEDGYLILRSFLDPTEVSSLLCETQSQLSSIDLSTHPLTKFSTGEASEHVSDSYFLTSGPKIRYFFEEDAFHPSSSPGQAPRLAKPVHRAINKFGHNLHGLSTPFRAVTLNERTRALARSLKFKDPRVLQSMVICKQPEIGGAVPAHQDSTFLYTDPPSAVGFWLALEDATVQNGCLSFAPGSHRRAPVRKRFVRKEPKDVNKGTTFVDVEGGRWPKDEEGIDEGMDAEEGEKYELGECKAGDLVIIHGNLLHKSERNTSKNGRIIYTFHMIEGERDFDDRNWLQYPGGPGDFTKLYEEKA